MDAREIMEGEFQMLATGDLELARQVIAPDHINYMAVDEPPACREVGVPGLMATGVWLRTAFSGLGWDILDFIESDDRACIFAEMFGVHTGPFIVYPPGEKPKVFPATGREIRVRQAHFATFRDGKTTSHVAVRDDMTMMTQLGYLPPNPRSALRLAKHALLGYNRRAVSEVTRAAAEAARDAATVVGAPVPQSPGPH
ncbi:ester cyclase [Nocardia sp. NPDC049149]|uniref:ester cyclase n=1 Tax=Nocardia sp. NPDC049149 TaxID=3364315 RepID=UPI00371968D4